VLPLLDYLGLRKSFLSEGHLPALGTASAWGSEQPLERQDLFTGRGNGWHIDRTRFDAWLRAQAVSIGARLIAGDVQRATPLRVGFELDLGGKQPVLASALIDATGRSARLARLLGARVESHDGLVAHIRWYALERPVPKSEGALIESVRDGWWYSATLPNDRAVQMLMSDASVFQRERGQLEGFWQRCLDAAVLTQARTRDWRATGERAVRPAHSQHTLPSGGEHWVAVGDAVVAFDPLASMGLGFALRSGMQGARVVAAALRNDPAPGLAYAASVEQLYTEYRARLRRLYALETRWPIGFWTRLRRETLRGLALMPAPPMP